MIQFTNFHRKAGVLRPGDLATPNVWPHAALELPLDSIYHYAVFDNSADGPTNDEYLFRGIKHAVPLFHVTMLSGTRGPAKLHSFNYEAAIRDFHLSHRRYRRVRVIEPFLKDHATPITFNYGFLNKGYFYAQTSFANHNRIANLLETIIDQMVATAQECDRHQFLTVNVPAILPTVTQLEKAAQELTTAQLQMFNSPSSIALLHLVMWLYGYHEQSIFSKIPAEKLIKINLLVEDSGNWFVLNLGQLASWKNPIKNLAKDIEISEKNPIQAKIKIDPRALMLRLLHAYLVLQEAKNKTGEEKTEETVEIGSVATQVPTASPAPRLINPDEIPDDAPVSDVQDILNSQTTAIENDLKKLDELDQMRIDPVHDGQSYEAILADEGPQEPEAAILSALERLAQEGSLTPGELKKQQKAAVAYKELKWHNGEPIAQFAIPDPTALKIDETKKQPDSDTVLDKSMLGTTLDQYHSQYIRHVLEKDIAASVLSVMSAAVGITSYRINQHEDAMGAHQEHVIRLVPSVGVPSIVRFKVPQVREDGTFMVNEVKYRLKTQRGDLPIRKTAYNEVTLTSMYGKVFLTRGRTASSNYHNWVHNWVASSVAKPETSRIKNPTFGDCSKSDLVCSPLVTALMQQLLSFEVDSYRFVLDQAAIKAEIGEDRYASVKAEDRLPIAITDDQRIVTVSFDGTLFEALDGEETSLGQFDEFLTMPISSSPTESISMSVFGKNIPLAIVLGMKLGLKGLISALHAKYRSVPAGKRLNLEPREYALTFSDETLVFNRSNKMAMLVLAGLDTYWRSLRAYSVHSFEKPGAYINLLENNQLGVRYAREIELMHQMFVDPLTKDILKEMKEPQTYKGLLFRAVELLKDDRFPKLLSGRLLRFKGYERIAAAVYAELITSLRVHNGKLGKASSGIEMHPYAVWKRIVEDPAKIQVHDINPVKELKEAEAVTYAGTGGRSKRAMTRQTRMYDRDDMGAISESTTDSSDVGINIHMSANPTLVNLRGICRPYDFEKDGPGALLSTSALLSPSSDRDDAKRVNFIAVQQEHRVACSGYHRNSIRTGADEVVAHRTSPLFCKTAKKQGRVRSITPTGILIDYADGTSEGFELGDRYGNAAGLTMQHSVITDLKEGQTVSVGDTICYHPGFFEKDPFDPKKMIYKYTTEAVTVLWESSDTFEDGSKLSRRLAKKLSSQIAKVKILVVRFDQVVHELVKVDQDVEADSILCYIEDAVTANLGVFDPENIDALRLMSAQSPKANTRGSVKKIELFYHGEREDMSESLQALAAISDKDRKVRANSVDKKPFTGRVDSSFRPGGTPLLPDTAAIRVTISGESEYGVGDKAVFGNQLKSVSGSIFEGEMRTKSGIVIDAVFGAKSVDNRIVNAMLLNGTAGMVLRVGGKHIAAVYRGKKKPVFYTT